MFTVTRGSVILESVYSHSEGAGDGRIEQRRTGSSTQQQTCQAVRRAAKQGVFPHGVVSDRSYHSSLLHESARHAVCVLHTVREEVSYVK